MVEKVATTRTECAHSAPINMAWSLEDKGHLLVMLYEKAMQCMEEAIELIQEGDMIGKGQRLIHAQHIVSQLTDALEAQDGDVASGEIAANLGRLYTYIYRRLVRGNNYLDLEAIGEAHHLMGKLLVAWKQAQSASLEGVPARRARL